MKLLRYLLCITFITFCTISTIAQIKTQREYNFIDHETNSKGLRKVGIIVQVENVFREIYENKYIYGCIDSDGNEVVPVKYKSIELNKNWDYIIVDAGSYTAEYNHSYGLLTADGKYSYAYAKYAGIIIDPYTFNLHKCAIFKTHNGHYGIVNTHAEEIVSPVYSEMRYINKEKGLLKVRLNGNYGIIDTKGRFIVEPKYETIFKAAINNLIPAITINKELVWIDFYGNIIKVQNISNYDNLIFNGWSFIGKKEIDKDKYNIEILSADGTVLKSIVVKLKKDEDNLYISDKDEDVLEYSYYNEKKEHRFYKYFDDNGKEYNSKNEAADANKVIRQMRQKDKKEEAPQLATIKWLNDAVVSTQANYQLRVGIKSQSKIDNVEVTINGEKGRGIKTVTSTDYDMIVDQNITLNTGANVVNVSVTNAAGTTKQEKNIVYRDSGEGLATIHWLDINTTSNKKDVKVRFGIKSKTKIEDVKLTVNGATSRGINTIKSDEFDMVVDQTVTLVDGTNHIVASARNAEGISTSEKVITYKGENPSPIINERRIALIVGNSNYSNSELNLRNPENDATLVAETLRTLGFDVIMKTDASLEEMDKLIDDFGEQAKGYDVALFYYAGHGIQNKGINYLLPININNLTEDNIKYKCVDLGRVLDVMEANDCKLKIVVLDACRNDPISRSWHRGSPTRGLAIVDAPIGTIISYATSPGKTASDGYGDNSPYTDAFVKTLNTPNLEISDFFKKVGALVKHNTNDKQVPWLSTSFTGDFFFNQQK